ncbi:MAG TPA: DUF1592 domain-containing protein [Polyangia bacterium]|nr:DUF1592 domain-containing protein [Polyangia bacterium]
MPSAFVSQFRTATDQKGPVDWPWRRLAVAGLSACLALTATACSGVIGDAKTGSGGSGTGPATKPGDIPLATSGPITSLPADSTRFPRLTHQQWENTVRDLLRLPAVPGLSSMFVAEPLQSVFDNNGGVLTVDQDLREDYQAAAENLANKVARTPSLLATLAPSLPTDPAGKASAFIKTFGARAFRRPMTDAEVARYQALFDKGATLFGSGDAFADGVELVMSAFLQSPNFLYRVESSDNVVNGRVRLSDHEVAARLSYGLLNSMPDDALRAAADAGKLSTAEGVAAEAKRIMALPVVQQTLADFQIQLMHMRDFDSIARDPTQAPLLGQGVGADLRQEALSLMTDVVFAQGRGVTELLTAPYTFANSRVAQLYGQAAPKLAAGQADPFVKINLDPTQRAGLLTQMGFITNYAVGDTPNLILRGVHIVRDVLCLPLPPPPNNVPPLPAVTADTTNRKRVEELTKDSPCNTCHTAIINPLGFAFENLNGLGQWRTKESGGLPVDASGSYSLDGMPFTFDGPVSLIKTIAATTAAHNCFVEHMIEYLYGRDITDADADHNLVAQAGLRSKNETSIKDLIVELVSTDAFITRLP